MEELIERTQAIHPIVASELERALKLADYDFHTEAILRLGRAVEASLYSVARELDLDLINRTIRPLASLRETIRQREVNIIRKRQEQEVKGLCKISNQLSEAIFSLAGDTSLWDGTLETNPRPNEQLFRELIQSTEDEDLKNRLRNTQGLLREIQNYRNDAAHASLDGTSREKTSDDYDNLVQKIEDFMELLLELLLINRAVNTWTSDDSVPNSP